MEKTLKGRQHRGEKYIRLGNLLLMLIFAVCSFAVMWTAVSCFRRINSAYAGASEELAAAQFAANHIRRAAGDITVYSSSDGSLDKMVISRDDGYENIIYGGSGHISEALVPQGMETSKGQEIFGVRSICMTPAENLPDVIRISVSGSDGKICTVYAYTEENITFAEEEKSVAPEWSIAPERSGE